MKFILYILILTLPLTGNGQENDVDKLKNVLDKAIDNSAKIGALNQLGAYYEGVSNYSQSLSYLEQAKQLNSKKYLPKQLIYTYNYIGYVYWHKSEYDSSLYYHNKALKIAEENNVEDANLAFTFLMLGNDYYDKGDFNKTSGYYFKSLKVADKIEDIEIQVQCHNRLSKLYFKMQDYSLSITHVQKALQLNSNDTRELGVSYNSFGNLSLNAKDLDSALYYFNQTLINFKKCGDIIGQSIASINLGDTYLASFGKKGVESHLDSSYNYYEKSFLLNNKVDNKFGMIYGLWGMADVSMQNKKYQKSLLNYHKALDVSIQIGARSEESNLYNKLHILFDITQNKDSSLYYLKKHIDLKNKVESTVQAKQLLKQESKYEAEKLIAYEKAEAEKKSLIEAEKNKWKNIFIIMVVLAAIVLSYVSYVSLKRLKVIRFKNEVINNINDELKTQKQDITDSITYARRIQNAILPSSDFVKECLPNSFLFYKPKDIVAGDFYWMKKVENKVVFAVADCTGHGVPGAMMSVVCSNALSNAIKEYKIYSPEKILNKVNSLIKEALRNEIESVQDGMDISLCVWDKTTNKLQYSGAYNSLYYCRDNKLNILKADRMPVGKYVETDKTFTLHELDLLAGDVIYLFTDGYADQFGGEKGKKFKLRTLKELLLNVHNLNIDEQQLKISNTFESWKGNLEQIDDVCVIGVRI